MTTALIREECVELSGDEELLFFDGFDDAIIGLGQRFNDSFVVYDQDKILSILQERDGLSSDEAIEFFDYNIIGAWLGPKTPCCVSKAP